MAKNFSLAAEFSHLEKDAIVSNEQINAWALKFGLSPKKVMLDLLACDFWPARFCRNAGVLSSVDMRRLLCMRVFIAGCGGLGGAIANMLARTGIGGFRICDPDVFEESNLNRQMFCTEKTIGQAKAKVVKAGLLEIASYLEVEALVMAADAENLPNLLQDMDVVIDCLDSVEAKKMLENAAERAGLAFLHGSVSLNEGLAYLDLPAKKRLSQFYSNDDSNSKSIPVLAGTVWGTAALMCSLLVKSHGPQEHSPTLHLDLSVPELEYFEDFSG